MKYLAIFVLLAFTSCGRDKDRAPDRGEPRIPHDEQTIPETDPCPDPPPPPTKPEPEGKKLFILLNGTGARCYYYQAVMNAARKKGYLVQCPISGNTGSGMDGLRAFQKVSSQVDLSYVLVSGHSQGGVGAVATAWMIQQANPELKVDTMAVQPAWFMNPQFQKYAAELTGEKMVICGSRDTVIPCAGVWSGYGALKDPKKFVTINATHFNSQRDWAKLLNNFD